MILFVTQKVRVKNDHTRDFRKKITPGILEKKSHVGLFGVKSSINRT